MAHLVPVARWFGFAFGYAVCEAVALVAVGRLVHPLAVVAVAHVINITFLVIAAITLVRVMFRMWGQHREARAARLGTYAKSSGGEGAGRVGAEGPGAARA